jgi:tetratricopeptide (TPR) repeat protein
VFLVISVSLLCLCLRSSHALAGDYSDMEEAELERLNKCVKENPNNPKYYYKRGIYRQDYMSDSKGAIADFDKAIALGSTEIRLYMHRAACYNSLGLHKKALQDLERLIKSGSLQCKKQGLVDAGITFMSMKDYPRALESFSQAIQLSPSSAIAASAHELRGTIFERLQQPNKALTEYDQTLKVQPMNVRCLTLRTNCAERLKKWQEAASGWSKVIEITNENVGAYLSRAGCYFALKDLSKSLADYNKAIQMEPKFARAYAGRACVYEALGKTQLAKSDRETARGLGAKFPQSVKWDNDAFDRNH